MGKALALSRKLEPVTKFLAGSYAAAGAYFERADHVPVEYEDEMIDPRKPVRFGMWLIILTFGFIGIWMVFTKIDSAAQATGLVVVESSRRMIQHLEGGIVDEILVQDGSKVKAGQVLIRLDNIRARAQLNIMQNEMDLSQAIEARLVAERDNLPRPEFPPELLSRAVNPDVTEIIKSQENQFQTRKASIEGQKAILEQRIQQYREQIVGLQALQKSKVVQLATIRDELQGLAGLLEAGYVTKPRVLALQREAARLEGEAGEHVSSIARSEQGIGEANLQIFQLQKAHQEDIARELRDVQARLAEARQRVVAAVDVMKRIDLVAPVDGTVMNLQPHTKGGVVGAGAPLMEIVPDNDELVVDVQVNPMDINTVHPGQKVGLHFSAANTRLVPVIYGKLDSISVDRYQDPRTGMPYYKGRVSISQEELVRLGPEHPLHAGMMAEAMIERGEQTVLFYALKPLFEAFFHSFREL